jgi:integrase
VTRLSGKREAVPIDAPWATDPNAKELAKAHALAVSSTLRGGSLAPVRRDHMNGTAETVAEYAKRWCTTGDGQDDKESHLRVHVLPLIGPIPVARVQPRDVERVVAILDGKIAAGTMSDKTARNVWATVARMFKDAAHAKPSTGLRCLEANPARDVQPPDRVKVKKAKQFVYPSEFLSFVWCEVIPLHWRRNVAIAVYTGLRDDEQRALRWASVDLEHGVIRVTETTNEEGDVVTGTKSNAARDVAIHPHLAPLLGAMHKEAKGEGRVCQRMSSKRDMARGLRRWMKRAGVTRAALHESTALNLNLRWHDLRATCGTWLSVEGRHAGEVKEALGHTTEAQTEQYVRNASLVRRGNFGVPFPALPESLIAASFTFSAFRAEKAFSFAMLGGVDGTRTRRERIFQQRDCALLFVQAFESPRLSSRSSVPLDSAPIRQNQPPSWHAGGTQKRRCRGKVDGPATRPVRAFLRVPPACHESPTFRRRRGPGDRPHHVLGYGVEAEITTTGTSTHRAKEVSPVQNAATPDSTALARCNASGDLNPYFARSWVAPSTTAAVRSRTATRFAAKSAS